MKSRLTVFIAVLSTCACALIGTSQASAAVAVTGASGGASLSADTAGNAPSPAWTTLGAITIAEGGNGDLAAATNATLVLKAPAGFEFNTAVIPDATFTPGSDIASADLAMTDATTITVTLTVSGTSLADTLTLGGATGIQVRPTAGSPLATGKHIYRPSTGGGTAIITGVTASADGSSGSNFGPLTEVVGAAATVQVETAANGTGTIVPAQNVTAGNSITVYAVARDAAGNFVASVTADVGGWSLVNVNGGASSGDLVPAGDRKSATFTGHLVGSANILAASGSLTPPDSGLLTVIPTAADRLAIATQPSSTAAVGVPFAQQPVIYIEDQYGNLRTSDTLVVTAARNGGSGSLLGTTSIAAVGGIATFTNLAHGAVSTITITFSSGSLTLATSQGITVNPGPFSQLQVLLPGETAAPGTPTGKTGTPNAQTAGASYSVTVNAVDANWNLVNTNDTVAVTSSDANATQPANAALVGGTKNFSVTNKTAGAWSMTASDVTHAGIAANVSPSFTVNAGSFAKLQLLVPGETAAPGTASGKTGAPVAQTTDGSFSVTVNAVDANWNRVSTAGDTVAITSTDPNATLPANAALSSGTQTFSIKFNTTGTRTVTATDSSDGSKSANTSPNITVNPGAFAKLQLLLPGQSAAPGTPTGQTGSPTARTAGTAFSVTVNAVDASFNVISTNDPVRITSSDANATLPANTAMAGGTISLSLTLKTAASCTVMASDVPHAGIAADISSAVSVNAGAFAKLQLLVPGETAAPGTTLGKTGTPTAQAASVGYSVTVNAVDANWNTVSTNDTVAITTTDANDILPANTALAAGNKTFSLTNRTAGNWTVTATDTTHAGITANTSPSISVAPGGFTKLQLLMPGETAAAGTTTGKTGTPSAQTAGTTFNVTVRSVDDNWNLINTVIDMVALTSSDTNAVLPASAALTAGTRTLSLMFKTAGSATVTATDATDGSKTANTSPSTTVNAGAFARLQLLMPGETAAPGSSTGKTGTSSAQTAGTAFTVTVNGVDTNWNVVASANGNSYTINIASSDTNATLPSNANLANGTRTFSVTLNTAGSATITASDVDDGTKTPSTSPSTTVNPAAFTKLQLLVPGETAAPGTTTGKTGTPTAQNTDTPFNVVVNAVDANWNLVNSVTDTVAITSSDLNATLPANAALSAGTQTFSVNFNTAGSRTLTATNVTNGSKTSNTSPSITVNAGAFAKLQVLMPGEAAAPGTTNGKTGSATAQTAGTSFSVTVKAVDASWNVISTNDNVHFTSSDALATLPANAALSAGSGTFNVTNKTSGIQTLTASDVTHAGIASGIGAATTINPAAASKLVIARQPSATAIAGNPFLQQPVIFIEDAYNNVRSNDTLVVTATRSAGAGSLLGNTNITAAAGVASFTNLAHPVATNITIQFTSGALTAATSTTIAVSAGATLSQLLVLLPGESLAPGTPTGRSGSPSAQTARTPFSVRVYGVDSEFNLINTVTDVVSIASSDSTAILPANAALVNGTNSFTITLEDAGSQTVTAADVTDGHTTGTSSALTVNPAAFVKLQLLVPGETAAPGTTTGKTGTPTPQVAGTAFNVTVNAVDANWNQINTNDTVKITSTDTNATLPANAALVAGTRSFSVTLKTLGGATITASNVTHTAIAISTSPSISVGNVSPALQSKPVVAIHDSELTRALEALPAVSPTPSGAGTTGFQWWPTNWHYFVMPESVKEALRADGTAYEVVGDADISSGRLLAANGQPRCPIVISLAAEAIRDDEIPQLTNYVAAGGTLLVGSSAFTRNTNGTTRGDFALANQMGLHMVNASLLNWAGNATFSKTIDHALVAHIPAGSLAWQMPAAADETPWGISPAHPLPGSHSIWLVEPSDAVVVAQGDVSPYLSVKQYGKGTFIYCSAMQPLMGHGGWAPGMYAYGIIRKAVEQAFASSKAPVAKLSAWPYAYDAALNVRHDLENYQPLISTIESSARYESTNGVKGDYYFCTGTLRVELTNSATIIASLRRAVSNYGATIGSHNGGLQNPNNPSLVVSNYDYWHWGPDEALNVIPPGYASGKAYALSSISNSFKDIEGWLSGLTNGIRSWVGCYFNSVREDSYDVQSQLGVKTAGEQKLGPFPHWTVSTRTPGMRYPFISLPASDWFVGSQVAQAMETGHTVSSVHAAVDFYYGLGGLINLYSHSLSDGTGQAGGLVQEYIRYGASKPRVWSTNAFGIYKWWLARSNAQITVSYSTNGNQSIATLAIAGATDPRTAIEVLVPQESFYGLQVLTNGIAASGGACRSNGQVVKVLVGTSVTNAEIRYMLAPIAQNDSYSVAQGSILVVPGPGVLSNDVVGLGVTLTAGLVNNPAHGSLTLNPNGGFSYLPVTNFAGVDAFAYQANDGTTSSGIATVTIQVTPGQDLFFDDFTRSAGADPLAPWQAAASSWAITNAMMQGAGALQSYSFAYAANAWTDYWVQGRFQFPVGAFGGGLAGRLNPLTGAHYAGWIYPEGSLGGSSVLKLLKFQNWTTFGYNNSSYTPMQLVNLSGVGTNWHTLRLAFYGNRIAVYFDGNQVISTADVEPQPYLSGGIGVDMWTDATGYTMSVDDVVASPLVLSDSYRVYENTTLTVPTPGPLGNDTEVYGTNLTAVVLSTPTNGILTLSANGGFNYAPATNFAGTDNFVYQANDGQTNLGATTVSITVNPALIVTADNQSRSYGAANPRLMGTIVGLQNGDNITANFSTSADTNSPVGGYPIAVALSDPDHKLAKYVVTTNNGTLTVSPAGLTVTADNQTKTYGQANPPLTGSLLGVQNNDQITANYSTAAGTESGAGGYPILASLADPDQKLGNYNVTTNNAVLSVKPALLTVTAEPHTRTYGAANPPLTATFTGFVNGDTQASAVTGAPAITTTAMATSDIGAYPITPALGTLGAANYTINFVDGTLTITPALLTGTADSKSRLYGASNPPLTVTYSGFLNGQSANLVIGVLSGSTPATTNSPTGGYRISVSGQSMPNYTIHYVDGTLTVLPAPLLVMGDDVSRTYGQPNPPFSATITGWVNGEDTNALTGELVLTCPAETNSPVGPYPIIPDGLTSTNYAITLSNGTLTVTTSGITVTANNQRRTYGMANPPLTGSIVGVRDGDSITVSYSALADTNSPVGDYPVTIALVDPDHKLSNYSVTTNNGTLSIEPATLTVTADNRRKTYGAANPELTGSLVGVQNNDRITASYLTPADVSSGVGTYPILASLADPDHKLGNYSVMTNNSTLTVDLATLTVTADHKTKVYGAANPPFTASYSGYVNGDAASVISGSPSLATSATESSPVGSYTITAGPGSLSATNYAFSFTDGTLDIGQALLTVTADHKTKVYGAANPPLTASYSGFVNGDTASVISGSPSLTTSATASSPVGSYTITASLGNLSATLSATNYAFSFIDGILDIGQALLTVTADHKTKVYGAANPPFTASYSGFVNRDAASVISGSPSLTTGATESSPVGSYAITAGLGSLSATNYAFTFTDGTLDIGQALLTVTADHKTKVYGAANPPFTASYSGFVNGDAASVISGSPSLTTSATESSPVGSYAITAGLGSLSATNYAFTFTDGTLDIGQALLTVTADHKTKVYGAANPPFTASYSGFVNGDAASVISGSPSLTTSATESSPVGSHTITAGLGSLSATNYAFTVTDGTLDIGQALLTITADHKTKVYGAANPPFTASYSGFVNGDAASVIGGSPSLTTGATESSSVGSYTITAALGSLSATNYAFTFSDGTLDIGQALLTVTADHKTKVYGAANPPWTASYSGFANGDAASVISGSPSLTTTATESSPVGSYAITAGLGSLSATNYAFTFTDGTLDIGQALLTVTADHKTKVYSAANPPFTTSYSGFVNGDAASVIGGSPSLTTSATESSPAGSYTIAAGLGSLSATNYAFTFTDGTLDIGQALLTVTADHKTKVYGADNPPFTASYSGYVNGDTDSVVTGGPSLTTSATASSPVGSYVITAGPGSLSATNYAFSFGDGTLDIGQALLTVTADHKTKVYGAANPPFTASYSGYLNGDTPTVITGSPSLTTSATESSPVGSYTITAALGSLSATNYAFTFSDGTLDIGQALLTVTADHKTKVYGAANPPFTASYSGYLNGDTPTVITGSPSLTTSATESSPAGSYAITAAPGSLSATNYAFTFTDGTLDIGQALLTVTADHKTKVYGAANPPFTASYSGYLNGDTPTVITGSPSLTTSATESSPAGSYAITAAPGSLSATNYAFTFTDGTLDIGQALLTVTADHKTKVYGAANPPFTASYSGYVKGDTASVISGSPSLTSTATASSPVGSYTITAALGSLSATNYAFSFTDGTLDIGQALLTVTADHKTKVYGTANPPFTASYSGFVNEDTASVISGSPSLTSTATASSPVGSYTITAALGSLSATNYAFSFTDGTLDIGQALLTVTADHKTKVYGTANPPFTASYSGFVNEDTASVISGSPSLTSTATASSPVGSYTITAALGSLSATNYAFSFTDGTLDIGQALLTVTADHKAKVYGAANPPFTASYSGFVNGDTASVIGGSPSLTSTATASSPVGSYTITAALGSLSATNYAFSFTDGTLDIGQALLTVTADHKTKVYGTANPPFTASYSGFVNEDTASVISGSPSLTSTATTSSPVGSYTITAALGSLSATNYAFSFTDGTLDIGQALLTVTANSASRPYGMANPALTGAIIGIQNGDNITATYATTATSSSPVGTYSIVPALVDPDHKLPNYAVTSSNGTLTVTAPIAPVIRSIAGAGTPNAVITWSAVSNLVYRVQYKVSLSGAPWLNLAPDVTATGATASFTDHPSAGSLRVYRVVLLSTVTPLTPLVIVANNASRAYGATNPDLSGTVTGVRNGDNITVTYSTAAAANSPVGTYPIIPSLSDPNGKLDNYIVSITNGTLTVTAAPLTAVANSTSRVYGASNPNFRGTLIGVRNGDNITVAYSTTATPASAVGSYAITPTLADPTGKLSNYAVTLTSGTLTVVRASLTVTANNASRPYGTANPAFTGTITGIKNSDNISANYSTTATVSSPVGTYPITPSFVDPSNKLPNYNVTANNGTLTVSAPLAPTIQSMARSGTSDLVITWSSISNRVYRVQCKASLISTNWMNLAPDVTATSTTASFTDHTAGVPQRFYRVVLASDLTPLTPLVVAANSTWRAYGAANPAFSGSLTGVQSGDNISATYATTALSNSPAGTYPIVPTPVDPNAKLGGYSVTIINGTLTVVPPGTLFFDDFSRGTNASLALPWVAQSGTWSVSGGVLEGGPNSVQSYAYANLGTNWTDYSVEARLQFTAGASGGGLGGRLNPTTGAHYAAWIYPENSLGGSNMLKLIKFQTWTSFSYTNTTSVPMQQVKLAAVGTNWHALKLAMQGNHITVSFDGNQLISTTDIEATPYTSGGASVDMWTSATPYGIAVDDFLVTSLVTAQTPTTLGMKGNGNGTVTATFGGTAGAQYLVQAATNLAQPIAWVTVSTNTAGANGQWTFTDSSTGHIRRFYRSALP